MRPEDDRRPPRLYAIADADALARIGLSLVEGAEAMMEGGARWIQLRAKKASSTELLEAVRAVLEKARPRGVRILVNDRVDIAAAAGADGVHLGQADLAPRAAREQLGAGPLVGWSTHSLDQGLAARRLPVDYVAVGPVAPTGTKDDPDPVVPAWLLPGLRAALSAPLVAIGGIRRETATRILGRGACAVAVVGDLLREQDPREGTARFLRALAAP